MPNYRRGLDLMGGRRAVRLSVLGVSTPNGIYLEVLACREEKISPNDKLGDAGEKL